MSVVDAKLAGNEPSWICNDLYEPGYTYSEHYTTNYGGALISPSGMLLECNFGIGRNQASPRQLEVCIDCNRFRVSTSKLTIEDELFNHSSMSLSHTGKSLKCLPVDSVLEVLLTDDNMSYAGITVKKTLLRLITISINLNKYEADLVKQIKYSWRKAINLQTTMVNCSKCTFTRQPITGIRKPILKGDHNGI